MDTNVARVIRELEDLEQNRDTVTKEDIRVVVERALMPVEPPRFSVAVFGSGEATVVAVRLYDKESGATTPGNWRETGCSGWRTWAALIEEFGEPVRYVAEGSPTASPESRDYDTVRAIIFSAVSPPGSDRDRTARIMNELAGMGMIAGVVKS